VTNDTRRALVLDQFERQDLISAIDHVLVDMEDADTGDPDLNEANDQWSERLRLIRHKIAGQS
jgi:hypothetical protein